MAERDFGSSTGHAVPASAPATSLAGAPASSPAAEFSEAARRKSLGVALIREMCSVTAAPARVRDILRQNPSLNEAHPVDGRTLRRVLEGYNTYARRYAENPGGFGKSASEQAAVQQRLKRQARIATLVNKVLFAPPALRERVTAGLSETGAPRKRKASQAPKPPKPPKAPAEKVKAGKKPNPPRMPRHAKRVFGHVPADRHILSRAELGWKAIGEMLEMYPNKRRLKACVNGGADLTVADARGRTLAGIIAEYRAFAAEFAKDPHARGESMSDIAMTASSIRHRGAAIALVEPALKQQLAASKAPRPPGP